MPLTSATIPRLTSLSHGAGCACKLGPSELAQVLAHIPVTADPRILVDAATRDDAAVFQVAPDRAIVATVDFFTPIVDSPYHFGRIAAANAFSDLYAMGATPLFGLNLVGWPRDALPFELLGEVLRGAADIVRETGAFVLGGHSVDDPEPKFGMVAIGEAHPDRVVTNARARPGDALVLTKPIGTGVLSTALKRDLATEAEIAPAVAAMTTLNAGAARAMLAVGVHAATDVTGFGLLGHLNSLLRASGVAAELTSAAVPLLPLARELAERGAVPGGSKRNQQSVADAVRFDSTVDPTMRLLLADAQTSGGLLIAVPAERLDTLVAALGRERTPAAAVIGRVTAGPAGRIDVR
ncbi:MAG TPA: selenide, water dikinase SelD [Gemmatimonadales bacterium]|nr:selenide, water dikinase SelD [Gemmatimonadales bacterium]